MSADALWDGYFADPFLLRSEEGYVVYGTSEPSTSTESSFRALISTDLRTWQDAGTVFTSDPGIGTDVWAPEVVHVDGTFWMYYSAGFGIEGHHLRVATSRSATGPFADIGVNLTPRESFAIDPHPFQDADGSWYLFFAHDVLDAERAGTHLAVSRMTSMTELDPHVVPVLQPHARWQLFAAERAMYGRTLDWYTLEGPTVMRRQDHYVLMYSGGSWEGPDYGVSYATARSPIGPWQYASSDGPAVISTGLTGLPGPGHNSVLRRNDGSTVTAFHAWNDDGSKRQLYVAALNWQHSRPVLGGLLGPA